MEEIDFERDSFADIVQKDDRYAPRAYALLMDVVHYLSDGEKQVRASEIMDEFRNRTLDQYGPMSYRVLTEWGLESCADLGEMMFNLVEGHRLNKDEDDTPEAFTDGFDFKEAFLGPFEV